MDHKSKVEFVRNHLRESEDIELPTLSDIYQKTQELINSGNATVHSLANIIEKDLALVIKILKIVNSVGMGVKNHVSTLQRAINILGFQELSNLLLSTSVMGSFEKKESINFSPRMFWEHSLAVAVGARMLAEQSPLKINPHGAFVDSLLHDIGKIFGYQFMKKRFPQVLKTCKEKAMFFHQTEDEVMGFNHQHIGQALAQEWKLPSPYPVMIGYHHTPELVSSDDPHYPYVCCVHLANILAKSLVIGSGGDSFVTPPDSNVL